MKFKQKAVEVEAFRLDEKFQESGPDWFQEMLSKREARVDHAYANDLDKVYGVKVQTPEGRAQARLGDYLVREPDGSIRVLAKAHFERLYEKVE